MKNKLILGLIAMVLLVTLSTTASIASNSVMGDSKLPVCSAEYTPDAGDPHAEGEVPINHDDTDCGMDHTGTS